MYKEGKWYKKKLTSHSVVNGTLEHMNKGGWLIDRGEQE